MENLNVKKSGHSLQELGRILNLLGQYCTENPKRKITLVQDLDNWQGKIFEAVSVFNDRSLSESVLRVVLKATFDLYKDDDFLQSLDEGLINPEWGGRSFQWKDIKKLDRIWELSGALIEVLRQYSKCSGQPYCEDWQMAIPHKELGGLVRSLLHITWGRLEFRGFRGFPPLDAKDWIDGIFYEGGFDDCITYDDLSFVMHYISLYMGWIAERFPKFRRRKYPRLFGVCAELAKYCIDLTGDPPIGPPEGVYEILHWAPDISLKCLCQAYNSGVPNDSYFEHDSLLLAVEGISEKLPGELKDQLLGVYRTNTDEGVQKGALALIETMGA
jgi:hypothetical protein